MGDGEHGKTMMIYLSREQVREIDRLALERFHIPGIVLMENAARGVADVALQMLGGDGGNVLVVCGGGNNGGDGLAAARHLHNRGAAVKIGLTVDPSGYRGDALANWRIVEAMGISAAAFDSKMIAANRPALIVDAIFGTGLTKAPREPFPEIAGTINGSGAAVLAVDVPSGLDCDTGEPLGACIKASQTVTLVAEKIGFKRGEAKKYLGKVTVGDIGCPTELIREQAQMKPS